MAWSRRSFGEPFSIPFDDNAVITDRDLEWFDGERLIIDAGEAATFTATNSAGTAAAYTEYSEIGLFDIDPETQDEFIAEGATTGYEIWDADDDTRVRIKGMIRRLPASPASEVPTSEGGELSDESDNILTDHLGNILEAA